MSLRKANTLIFSFLNFPSNKREIFKETFIEIEKQDNMSCNNKLHLIFLYMAKNNIIRLVTFQKLFFIVDVFIIKNALNVPYEILL